MRDSSLDRPRVILESAIKVFGRLGFQKATVDDIAREAAISKPGLYLHFRSKQDLFEAALDNYLAVALAHVHLALASEAPLEACLATALDAWFGSHLATFSPIAIDIVEPSSRQREVNVAHYQSAVKAALTRALVAEGADAQRAADGAETLFLCGLVWKEPGLTPERLRESLGRAIRVCVAAAARPVPLRRELP